MIPHDARFPLLLSTVIGLSASIGTPLHAHVHHASLTEVRCTDETMGCEAMLRFPIDELERVLSGYAKTRVIIDDKTLLKKQLASYLSERFIIEDSIKKPATIQLLGFEKEGLDVWVFFEFSVAGLTSTTLQNSLFFETSPKQVNTVNLYLNGNKKPSTFHFSRQKKKHSIEFTRRKRPAK